MVHVYREQPVQRHRFGELVGASAILAAFMLPLVFGIAHGLRHGFTGDDAGGIAFGLLTGSLLAWAFYTHAWRDCYDAKQAEGR